MEVDGPGCYRRNGEDQWPCFLLPGQEGIYRVTYTHDQPEELTNIKSSIHGLVTLRGRFSHKGIVRSPIAGEVNKNAQRTIRPGTLHIIEERFTVPGFIRQVQQNMKIEFKLTSGKWQKETVICFIVPVINQ